TSLAPVEDVLHARGLERHGDDVSLRGHHPTLVGAVHAAVDASQRLDDGLGGHAVLERDRYHAAQGLAIRVSLVAALPGLDEHLGGEVVLLVDRDVEATLLAVRFEALDLVGEPGQPNRALEQRLSGQAIAPGRRGRDRAGDLDRRGLDRRWNVPVPGGGSLLGPARLPSGGASRAARRCRVWHGLLRLLLAGRG